MTPTHPALRAACLALLIAACLFAAPFAAVAAQASSAASSAAESDARRAFDLPAGPATSTFKQFIAQSRVQVMFAADDVVAVRTNALKGDFTPHEAMERMIEGTPLIAVQTPNGSIAIKGAPTPNAVRAAQTRSDRPLPNPSVETAPPRATNATRDPVEEKAIELSPFVVNTNRDVGFVAASSLAGGRLAGELKDTPVAYSVITRDFIDALGLTDLQSAASWTTNTVENVAPFSSDLSNQPISYSVRGGGGGGRQRNFFLYFAPMDSYSLERFDFGRGPNAVLFGNGGLGGVSSSTTKQARFDSTFATLAQEVGSWDKYRTTLDANHALNDKFAMRTAMVWSDRDGWREREFEKMKAAFLTGTLKLGRNASVRLEGEYGEMARTAATTTLNDRFSGWDGRATYSGPLTTLPANANAIGVARRPANYLVYDPFSGLSQPALMNYQNDPFTLSGGANANVPIGGFLQVGPRALGSANASFLHAVGLPPNRFDNAIAGSAFRAPSEEFTISSDVATLQQRFKDLQITIDHRIGPVFLQVAADVNRTNMETRTGDVRGAPDMFIDINRVLPNGADNPHFLQPYADLNLRTALLSNDVDAVRGAAGMVRDRGKWGHYTFSLLGGVLENRTTAAVYNFSFAENPDHRRWGDPAQALRLRRYWNEPSRPYAIPATVRYIDPVAGISRDITPLWTIENNRSDSLTEGNSKFTYGLAALNAKFFDDRLVLLGAVRSDRYKFGVRNQAVQGDYPVDWDGATPVFTPPAPDDYNALTYVPKDAAGNALGPAVEAGTRPRASNGDRLPQYANDRFKDDFSAPLSSGRELTRSVGAVLHPTRWVSPYINYAETFGPPSPIQRIDSSLLPATVARGWDYGMRFSLLKNRININAIYYENEEENSAFDPAVQGAINGLLASNPVGDNTVAGRNKRGIQGVPSVIRDRRDRSATGYELEITANVAQGWRLTLNAGFPKVYEENAFKDSKAFLAANDEVFRQVAIDAGVVIRADNIASVDTSIPLDQRSPDVNDAVTNYNNLQSRRAAFIDRKRLSQDQPNLNFYSDYTFQRGRFKGFRLGAGLQYRARPIIGDLADVTIVDPNNPNNAIDDPTVDAYTPIYSPTDSKIVTATVGYTLRFRDRRSVLLSLRVNNLLDRRGPQYRSGTVLRPRDGDYTSPAREEVPSGFGLHQPISFTFTATLKL